MIFVKGPNEYGGCTINNTYTSWMAVNNLKLAKNAVLILKQEHPDKWKELSTRLELNIKEIDEWDDIIQKAKINYDQDNKLYIEDDLFMKLEPLEISKYKTDDRPLYYKISYDRLQRYRVIKQADVLLLMTLFPDKFTHEQKDAAWRFYEPLILHDSSLSFGTHAQLAAQLGIMDKADEYFNKSLFLDLHDVMENTGKEGLHFAAFGVSWQALVFGFADLTHDVSEFKIAPRLPEGIKSMKFNVIFKNELWNIRINQEGGRAVKLTEL
ncbi:MAG: glycoside hydrolase family 65 protein [Clostridiaceae bacterium]|nr:glycoside hydrolase family 65 protein [Clostridiaceae bacterium]